MKRFTLRISALLALFNVLCVSPVVGQANPVFGPFEAIVINSDVVRGVKVDENDKIWLLLNPRYKENEIRLKISNSEGADYRKWYTGEFELVSPANQGKAANEWTDWIRTQSMFIEYWMEGQLILHLKRAR